MSSLRRDQPVGDRATPVLANELPQPPAQALGRIAEVVVEHQHYVDARPHVNTRSHLVCDQIPKHLKLLFHVVILRPKNRWTQAYLILTFLSMVVILKQ